MKRLALQLGLVLALAAGWAASRSAPDLPPTPSPLGLPHLLGVNGLSPHATREQAYRRLGQPDCEGPLKVGPHADQPGWYAEWGSPRLSWNGRPTLTFWPDGTLLATIGSSVQCETGSFELGASRDDILTHLGPPTGEEHSNDGTTTLRYLHNDCELTLFLSEQGRLTRILRSSPSTASPPP